ncbi:PadR family transcriptional regulator [Bacillus anthracis]|nr:PadR family transcriptional regulator [Bacillus anthracis]THG61130.1 PadR family transcriptional regulator [Bacillus sp. HUB-I-004]
MSVSRYITKIADIFGVTIDILQKSLIYLELRSIYYKNR